MSANILQSLSRALALAEKSGEAWGIINAAAALKLHCELIPPHATLSLTEAAIYVSASGLYPGCGRYTLRKLLTHKNRVLRPRNVGTKQRPRLRVAELQSSFRLLDGCGGKR